MDSPRHLLRGLHATSTSAAEGGFAYLYRSRFRSFRASSLVALRLILLLCERIKIGVDVLFGFNKEAGFLIKAIKHHRSFEQRYGDRHNVSRLNF